MGERIVAHDCTCICKYMNISLHFQVHLAAPCLLRFMFHQAVFGLLTGVCQPSLCTVTELSHCTLLALGTYGSYGTLLLTFQMCIPEPSVDKNNIRHNLRPLQRSSCWSRIALRRSSALLPASSAMTLRRILVSQCGGTVGCGSSGHAGRDNTNKIQ